MMMMYWIDPKLNDRTGSLKAQKGLGSAHVSEKLEKESRTQEQESEASILSESVFAHRTSVYGCWEHRA